jgi:hypothetical protein
MSIKTSIENYRKAKSIYKEIDDAFYDLEIKKEEETEFTLNQLVNRLNDLRRSLKYINVSELEGNYTPETIEAIKYNINIFQEALFFWERSFLRAKYTKSLNDPVRLKYIPGLNLFDDETEKWGGSNAQVAKKFITAITHPDNVIQYEKAIKRMALGTMTQREFRRIFDVIKHEMKQSKFTSFKKYKEENES